MGLGASSFYAFLQGVSEFLPISSSGHLALYQIFLGLSEEENLRYVLAAHLGTLIAVVIYLRTELFNLIRSLIFNRPSDPLQNHVREREHAENSTVLTENLRIDQLVLAETERASALRWIVVVIIASIPAAVVGLTMKEIVAASFQNLYLIGAGFWVTSLFLFGMYAHNKRNPYKKQLANHDHSPEKILLQKTLLRNRIYRIALIVGMAQALAIFPGVSRSGVTIAVASLLGVPHALAARLSFFIVIPLIGGSFWLELSTNPPQSIEAIWSLLIVIVLSAVFGLAALQLTFAALRKNIFHYFAYYLVLLGLIAMVYVTMQ
ncbi:undecaprenyl-diphosphatase [Spirochaetota bacterium]|nr:undecaprenyl-diphosphatase [Spirochaetota bacterium]